MDFFSLFFSSLSGYLRLEKYNQVYKTRVFLTEQQQKSVFLSSSLIWMKHSLGLTQI